MMYKFQLCNSNGNRSFDSDMSFFAVGGNCNAAGGDSVVLVLHVPGFQKSERGGNDGSDY